MFAVVCPFKKSFDDIGLVYKIPKELEKMIQIGTSVDIPLQNQIISGIVLQIHDKLDVNEMKIKEIVSVKYSEPILLDYQILTIRWMANYYFCLIHHCLTLFMPKTLCNRIEKINHNFESKKYSYNFNFKKTLNESQNKALKQILDSKKNIIFYGVTGSGKTEIYINLIKHYLEKGKQCLLLIPEIILNNQIFERFKEVFGNDVLIINSSITDKNKYEAWKDIHENNAKIIVGTRSSIFYPFADLGIVIVDEEHDMSYKSDSSPKYETGEVLNFMKKMLDFKLVFASGTPSVKSIYKGLKGEYEIVNLLEEYKEK